MGPWAEGEGSRVWASVRQLQTQASCLLEAFEVQAEETGAAAAPTYPPHFPTQAASGRQHSTRKATK